MSIEMQHVTKTFGAVTALEDVSLTVPTGELVALLGPSGSGKTTLLRIVAGLETPDRGTTLFHGQDATARHTRERGVGFVFQHYALFRHMTVLENVAFGLRVRPRQTRPSEPEIRRKVHELLGLVHLDGMAARYPAQLSGGQRQRVALARALAVEPKVLLLDEPFGSLDATVRKELRRWLRRLHDEIGITSVFVTHDQEEALEVADRVVILREGRIEQIGTPQDVYEHPASPFVYHFLGNVNVFHGRVEGDQVHFGAMTIALPGGARPEAAQALIYARPHLLEIDLQPRGTPLCRATVAHINPAGPLVKVDLVTETGSAIHVEIPQERHRVLQLCKGTEVFVSAKDVTVFPDAQGLMFGSGI